MTHRKTGANRLRGEAGNGAGGIILMLGAASLGVWLFCAVIDWIVGVREDRESMRQAQIQSEQPRGPFKPKALPGTQINY